MRRTYFVGLAALVAIVAAAVGAWHFGPAEEPPLAPREAAERLLADCRWSAAVSACDTLLAETPEDGEVWFWRGRARLALGEHAAAVADFTQAIARRPNDAEPHYFRAMVYERLGQIDAADADYVEARRLDPNQDKQRLARRDEEAARELQAAVKNANRAADERSAKRLSARMSHAEAQAAALRDANAPPAMEEDLATAAAKIAATAEKDAGKSSATDGAATLDGATSLDAAFEKLTKTSGSATRTGHLASLPATPDELASLPPAPAAASSIADPNLLRTNLGDERRTSSPGVEPTGSASLELPSESPGHRVPAAPRSTSADELAAPLSAWEQFQQRQALLAAESNAHPTAPQRTASAPVMGQTVRRNSEETLPDGEEEPWKTSKYPIKGWKAPGESSLGPLAPNGPLAARSLSGLPLSTALPQPNAPRRPENALSTATAPLPAPAVERSAAAAASPPGVLSTAMHDLFAPQSGGPFGGPFGGSSKQAKPPLATYTAPLPKWMVAPEPPRLK